MVLWSGAFCGFIRHAAGAEHTQGAGICRELAHLAAIEIPVALIAVAFTSAYYIFLDRRCQKRDLEAAAEKAGNTAVTSALVAEDAADDTHAAVEGGEA